jgi:hypothetical protein
MNINIGRIPDKNENKNNKYYNNTIEYNNYNNISFILIKSLPLYSSLLFYNIAHYFSLLH